MKKVIYLFLIVFILIGCEEVVDVSTPTAEPRLVIEGSYNYNDNTLTNSYVKLTLTSPFFENTIREVTNAEVKIIDITNNITFDLSDDFNSGIYSGSFFPSFNTDYKLQVIYQDELYESTIEQLIPTVPIDNFVQGDATLFEGDEKEVIITYTDIDQRQDYYLFDFGYGLFFTSDDKFYQGNTFSFSYFYDDLETGDIAEITMFGINERHFNYMNVVIGQTQTTGNPFSTVPATARGNIVNKTNPENYPLGYFRISEMYHKSIILD